MILQLTKLWCWQCVTAVATSRSTQPTTRDPAVKENLMFSRRSFVLSKRGDDRPPEGFSFWSVWAGAIGHEIYRDLQGWLHRSRRPSESARAALEQVLVLLGRKRNNVHIFDEKGQRRTPGELCLLAAREVTMLPDDER
jgi:hypothetical protein